MGSMWLACCNGSEAPRVRHEIEARDAGARLLRVDDAASLLAVAQVMAGIAAGAAVCVHDGEDAEGAIENLVRLECAETVLAFVDEADAGLIARLFFAGATEVIAVGDVCVDGDGERACAGEGPEPVLRPERASGDDLELEVPPWERAEPACEDMGEDAYARTPGDSDDKKTEGADARSVSSGPTAPDAPDRADGDEGPAARDACEAKPADGGAAEPGEDATASRPAPDAVTFSPRTGGAEVGGAPLVVAISGLGGCGKTTVVSAMAWQAAQMGLRAAVVDLDLMFGNLHNLMGVERVCDLGRLVDADGKPMCSQEMIEATAMRIAPGLTLWGPCFAPEYAELMAAPVEELIGVLRHEADVIFADTSVFWGDAVASAVSSCNRCLVVGSGSVSAETSTVRAVALATRIGVPKTRMTCLFNRFGAPGCDEERAMRFEMAVALRSRARISDGGQTVHDLLSFGKLGDLMATSNPFTRDVQTTTYGLLKELGCPLEGWEGQQQALGAQNGSRSRIKLPWKHEEGAGQ